jgi:transposase
MGNVLSVNKRNEVLALGRLGWPLRRIQEATGVRRETAGKYLKAAGIVVRRPRGRDLAKATNEAIPDSGADSKAASEVTTGNAAGHGRADLLPPPIRGSIVSACEPHREMIDAAVLRGRTAKSIWEDLVDDHGFAASYSSVRRFAARLSQVHALVDAHPVIVSAPGTEGQVDYGDGPMVRSSVTGKYRRTRMFALTLGCSRKSVWLLSFQSSSQTWSQFHETAFRRLGGAPSVIVLDNLKEGVIKPDIYDPAINPLYADVLRHYGATPLPCRVRHPNRKGKVESAIGYAQKKLRGLRFETIEEAQAYLDRWTERWADKRIHGTTKRQVAQMFAEERPHLTPLPVEPFRYYHYGVRTVHLDGYVEVEAGYYAPPAGWVGRRVNVQWDALCVRILDPATGQLLREHVRTKRGHRRIRKEDEPKKTPPAVTSLLGRADTAGRGIGAICRAIHQRRDQAGVRQIQGVLALARKHGVAAVEEAADVALEVGVPEYRFVRRYIERRASSGVGLRQIDPLIRSLSLYRQMIEGTEPEQENTKDEHNGT